MIAARAVFVDPEPNILVAPLVVAIAGDNSMIFESYPMSFNISTNSSAIFLSAAVPSDSKIISALSVNKFTLHVLTLGSTPKARSTDDTQDAQVIPCTETRIRYCGMDVILRTVGCCGDCLLNGASKGRVTMEVDESEEFGIKLSLML